LLNLKIIRNTLTGKPWLSVGRLHVYVQFLERTLGNVVGKVDATGCDGITISVG